MDISPESLYIRIYPDKALRRKGRAVESFDETVAAVARRMIELMHEAGGIGLAAPQVGLDWQLFVAHVPRPEDDDEILPDDGRPRYLEEPRVYANPRLTDFSREVEVYEEGCLSLPDVRGDVRRPESVTITAQDVEGNEFTQHGAGLLARCWQHEYDHLQGKLIIDRMSQLSRMKVKSALRWLEERGE